MAGVAVGLTDFFQSSFCEDTYWNCLQKQIVRMKKYLSILILRGYLLKYTVEKPGKEQNIFQSSFCEDTYWNCKQCQYFGAQCTFQSSFCEDTYWNTPLGLRGLRLTPLSILILRGYLLKYCKALSPLPYPSTFNPHFARIPIEMMDMWKSFCLCEYLSILILRGYLLKSYIMKVP